MCQEDWYHIKQCLSALLILAAIGTSVGLLIVVFSGVAHQIAKGKLF